MLSAELEKTLHRALALASERKHELATLEHLLLALCDDLDAVAVLKACGVDVERLRQDLTSFVENELDNLAGSRKGRRVLAEHQAMLNDWIVQSGDQGATPETDAMYDSDMKIYLDTMKTRRPERFEEIQGNVNLMKRWASEGK